MKLINKNLTLISIVCISVLLIGLLCLVGCSCSVINNGTFAKMSKEEQSKYVSDYLKDKYFVDVSVGEISKKTYAGKFKDDMFSTNCYTNDGREIKVLITDNGDVVDDGFLLSMQSQIEDYFRNSVKQNVSSFNIKVNAEVKLHTLYDGKYSSFYDVIGDSDVNFVVRLYIMETNELSESQFYQLKTAFPKSKIDLYIYYVPDINNIKNVNDNTYSLYERIKLEK